MTMTLTTTARQRRLIALGSLTPGGENVLSFSRARAQLRPAANLPSFASSRAPEELNLFAA